MFGEKGELRPPARTGGAGLPCVSAEMAGALFWALRRRASARTPLKRHLQVPTGGVRQSASGRFVQEGAHKHDEN